MLSRRTRGFTLLEILIAVFILGIISAIMVRGLQIVITSKDNLTRISQRLNNLDMSTTFLGNDIRAMINRPIADANGASEPAVILRDDGQQTLEFSRGGVSNPLAERRSTIQRVAYQLAGGKLVRLSWPVLDRVASTTPEKRVLLKNVESLHWQFVANDSRLYSSWPGTNVGNQILPKAVKVTIKIQGWGTISRLFMLSATMTTPQPIVNY